MIFHPLRVAAVEPLTEDAVAVTFDVPPALRRTFRRIPGQHLTLRRPAAPGTGGGPEGPAGPAEAEVRRTYSVCTPAGDGARLTVGIRLVAGGVFSGWALKELAAGDTVDVLPPRGRFVLDPRPGHYAAVVGGSGITPVLSIAGTLLAQEPAARFCLLRSDRTVASTMFLEETADLKDRFPDRFQWVQALSREEQQSGLPTGRLDAERLGTLLPALLPVDRIDGWFLCGPHGLVRGAEQALAGLGVPAERVHQEVFHVADAVAPATTVPDTGPLHAAATVRATLDGRSGSWPMREGETVLETVLRNRGDAPYACKGGVCGTCRVRLLAGEVRMDRNFALEQEELDAGFVLACQSRAVSGTVEVDFDA